MNKSDGTENSDASMGRSTGLRPWKPGQSGNPSGRPKVAAEVRALARQYGAEALAKLVALMRHAPDERVQLAAARELLNRGYGKVPQSVEFNGTPLVAVNVGVPQPAGGPLTAEMTYRLMIEGDLPADPRHPALLAPLELPEPEKTGSDGDR